jgi:hypothetical protein
MRQRKRFVADDGASQIGAELVQPERLLAGSKGVASVENVIAEKFKQLTAKGVCPAMRCQDDLTARAIG